MNESTNSGSQPSVTRRDFLKKTSSAVIGGAILGGLTAERAAHAAGSDQLKIALIGCGGRGSGAANQALSTQGNVKLVAMADAHEDQLARSLSNLTKQHPDRVDVPPDRQFVGLDAYKKAISMADVVVLATPPGFRPIHFEEAVKQNKHIFFEKPVAVDAPGVRQVLAAAEEAKKKNLKVGCGLQRHHQAGYIETIKRLHDGAVGDIVAMRAYWNGTPVGPKKKRADLDAQLGRKATEMEYQIRNWYMFVWLCGDHICEQHIHNLDVINWIKGGHPVKAQGQGGRAFLQGPDTGEIFDHHFVEFEYEDGSHLLSQCRQIKGCWNSVSEHVTGTKGTCDVNSYTIRGADTWKYRGESKDPYQVEHDDLFDAIRNNKPYNEAVNGAMSTMTAIFGRMATYSGKEITWEQAFNSNLSYAPSAYTWDTLPKVLPGPDGNYPHAMPGVTVAL